MALDLCDVSFGYGGRRVLERVFLRLEPGERVAVIGANGAGKTTLLKIIGGVLRASAGSVRINGDEATAIPKRRFATLLGMVPQEIMIPFAFTVRDLVELGRTPYVGLFGGLSVVDRRAVERAMAATDSAALAARVFNELSGGERQRALIAMALAQEPEILLLDEPTQGLDVTRQAEVLDVMCQVNAERGLTVLAAIHDLNLAAMYFDRLVVLAAGTILADGPPHQIIRPDVLERAYAGRLRFSTIRDSAVPIVLPASRAMVNKQEMS